MGLFSSLFQNDYQPKQYHCYYCDEIIEPSLPKCPHCNKVQPLETRANYLDREVVEIKCNKCGCETSFYTTSSYFDLAYCTDCGEETYYNDVGKLKLPPLPQGAKCPYCGSTYTKKISTTSKVAHVATLGVLGASKVVHQWHCKNCKSDF